MNESPRWTETQLRSAVASATSWKGAAIALGLKPTNAGGARKVRAQAEDLGLDVSHFTGIRKWSDRQLREAIESSVSWADAIQALDVRDSADLRVRLKGRATRLGIDVSHLEPMAPPATSHEGLLAAPPQRAMLRWAAGALAMAWFELHGIAVALPLEPQEYDLLVSLSGGIKRVQVKSSTRKDPKTGKWHVGVGRRPYSLDKSAGHTSYDPDSLDYFFVITGDGSMYLIPSDVIAGRIGIYADTYSAYRVGDGSSLLTWPAAGSAEETAA